VLGDNALGDAGRFVDLLGQRLAIDQILILHDARLFRDHRHGERIPLGDAVALRDLRAVGEQDHRTIRQTVHRTLTALVVDDRQLAVAGEREATAAAVHDGRHVPIAR
jgi:hypothetical protein